MNESDLHWMLLKEGGQDTLIDFPDSGGVYVFLLSGYPFYVGTAKSFRRRLRTHRKLFRSLDRTFIDPALLRDSTTPWVEVVKGATPQELARWVFVAGSKTEDRPEVLKKSQAFWEGLTIVGAALSDSSPRLLKGVELSLQRFFIEYSQRDGRKLPLIPGLRYTFFGKQESVAEISCVRHTASAALPAVFREMLQAQQDRSKTEKV